MTDLDEESSDVEKNVEISDKQEHHDHDHDQQDHNNEDEEEQHGAEYPQNDQQEEKKAGEEMEMKKDKDKEGFAARLSRQVARYPRTQIAAVVFIACVLSAVGMIVGNFTISTDNAGWQSRGTLISERQTQLLLSTSYQEYLFYVGETAWDDLLDNVQPGWEVEDEETDDDDSGRRRRRRRMMDDIQTNSQTQSSFMTTYEEKSFSLDISETTRTLLRDDNNSLNHRLLQDQASALLPNCETDWYMSSNMTDETRLWPVWRPQNNVKTALDPAVLRDICEAEENTQRYLEENDLCFGCDDGKCLPPFSIVLYARFVIPNAMDMTCGELGDAWGPYQQETEKEWKECIADIRANYGPNFDQTQLPASCPFGFSTTLVDENFDATSNLAYTSSIFATSPDDVDELYDRVDNFDRGSSNVFGAYDTQHEDFSSTYLNTSLLGDMALAMGSAVVATIAVLIHTGSPFLTIVGLTQIMLSFPLAYFVYNILGGLEFFPFLNFMGIFVVFALGAGDVFVAVDKWKNGRTLKPDASTADVAAVVFPDAAGAMFLTTITTAVAFLATAIAPVAPIRMFAIFCGLIILFDYIMNVLLVFPALCIYDEAIMSAMEDGRRTNCCIKLCGAKRSSSSPSIDEDADMDETDPVGRKEGEGEEADETMTDKDDGEKKDSLIRTILKGYYQILHRLRWLLFFLSAAALGVSTYYASTFGLPNSSDVRLLHESVQYEQNYFWRLELLSETLDKASGSTAFVIWGVDPADTGNHNDPTTWSQLVLDNTFDPSSTDAQVYLHEFCTDILEEDFAAPVEANYTCPMQHFHRWLEDQYSMMLLEGEQQQDGNFPTANNNTNSSTAYADNCAGSSGLPVDQEVFDDCIIGWANEVGETSILSNDGKVRIMFFPFSARVRFDDNYSTLDKEWNLIENWMKNKNNNEAPDGVKRGYFSSEDFWWYDSNGQMLRTAYGSAAIALTCAAIVILASSRSFVLTMFSTLTIAYVLTSVTAMLAALGWTLGFLEAICMAILIGVSVDFVIHFCHAYAHLPGHVSRGDRTQHALIEMGPSILATGITTVAAAIIMFFTVFIFFQKFALILFLTIIQAFLGSFVVFLAMADSVGPSQPTYLVDHCLSMITGHGATKQYQEEDSTP